MLRLHNVHLASGPAAPPSCILTLFLVDSHLPRIDTFELPTDHQMKRQLRQFCAVPSHQLGARLYQLAPVKVLSTSTARAYDTRAFGGPHSTSPSSSATA